jgi:hypothetical protein
VTNEERTQLSMALAGLASVESSLERVLATRRRSPPPQPAEQTLTEEIKRIGARLHALRHELRDLVDPEIAAVRREIEAANATGPKGAT